MFLTMPRHVSEYDDRSELADYLWHNYPELFTINEKLAAKTLLAEQKMAAPEMSEAMRRVMERDWVARGNPEIDVLLQYGSDHFRVSTALRVMEDCQDRVFVNRCPSCSRIVATPRARQCLWCGHDWHEKSPHG